MARLIAESHALCIQTFQQLCEAASDSGRCPESLQLVFLDELDKYKIWSGNLGASHAGRTYKLSLDYRLREATFYKDQVISIIDTLQRHVEHARQIISGERKPFEDLSESDSEEESVGSSPSNDEPYSQGHDSPWGSSSESDDAPGFELSKAESKALDGTSGLLPPATELAQLLEAIKLTIKSLYRLPIRKPAPVDRLKGDLTDTVSCFQPFDYMYVRDKFPRLSVEVANRIASHITRRRQLLLYRQKHQELLRPKESQDEAGSASAPTGFQTEINQHPMKTRDEPSSAQLHHATASQPESKAQTLRSKATTFVRDEKQPPQLSFLSAPSVAESISKTSIAASQFTQETPVEVPPRPKDWKGTSKTMFQCKFCALTTQIESDRAWKKHVLSDLQPYICTFPGCNLGDHMFANRDTWFQHEVQMHRVEYFCNTESHPMYMNSSDFMDHMQREHGISRVDLAKPASMNMFKHPASSSEGICNLCFREQPVKNMKGHVSKHLEQVSTFAIPRAEYDEGDVDAGEDQSCQAQHNLEESISQDDEQERLSDHRSDTGLPINCHPEEEAAPEENEIAQMWTEIPDNEPKYASGYSEQWQTGSLCPNCGNFFTTKIWTERTSYQPFKNVQRSVRPATPHICSYPEISLENNDGQQIRRTPFERDGMEKSSSASAKTYLLAPNFDVAPNAVHLGAIIVDPLDLQKPLSLPKLPLSTMTEVTHKYVFSHSKNVQDGVWSQFLKIVGGTVGYSSAHNATSEYSIDSLETVTLLEDPTEKEVSDRIYDKPEVQDVLSAGILGRPVYMITGLKIAKGLRVIRQNGQGVQETSNASSDIVFAYRLHVIAKKGLWGKFSVGVYTSNDAVM